LTREIDPLAVELSTSIRDVMRCIDRNALGVALVIDVNGGLIATITDGDIRRAILSKIDLDQPVSRIVDQRSGTLPITASVNSPKADVLKLMKEHSVRHVPLVDEANRPKEVALLSELAWEADTTVTAVVMAGGQGTRLRPLTHDLPKPMLPMGDRPLLEVIIRQLRDVGIRQVHVTTQYKGDLIQRHFGNGHDFGVEIRYLYEEQPLGTAGALGLFGLNNGTLEGPLLVMNGDILTGVSYQALLDFHREQKADLSIGVRQYELRVPYGIVETDSFHVVGISEKPTIRHFVNAGIYVLDPSVCANVPVGKPYSMPDLIANLLVTGHRVVSFPIHEYWLDIGQLPDYEKALSDVAKGAIILG
jgi:dTDP-glucose pyrophosphorylase